MVRLTITEATAKALSFCNEHKPSGWPLAAVQGEPFLGQPVAGGPIEHGQLIELSRCLQKLSEAGTALHGIVPQASLVDLLRNSRVYIEPPPPKLQPTTQFKALMARLREEEEARAYERMINPPLPSETFADRYSSSPPPQLFAQTALQKSEEEDEVTFADVNRQLSVIINVLVSIICCSVAIWMAAWHWSTPTRLGLSMGGSSLVGVAEVAIYAGYLRRIREAKVKEKKTPEVKEIMETWVIEKERESRPRKVEKISEPRDELRLRKTLRTD